MSWNTVFVELFVVAFLEGFRCILQQFCHVWSRGTWHSKHDVRYKQWLDFNDLMSQRLRPQESFHVVQNSIFNVVLKQSPFICFFLDFNWSPAAAGNVPLPANVAIRYSLVLLTSTYCGGGLELPSQQNHLATTGNWLEEEEEEEEVNFFFLLLLMVALLKPRELTLATTC